jgi:hypothetical protein
VGCALIVAGVVAATLTGGCNLPTTGVTAGPPSRPTIALIGDSISGRLAIDLRTPDFHGPRGVAWSIASQAGAGWGEGQNARGNWPLGIVQGNWAATRVLHATAVRPSAIAIELGTNDALRASFAFVTNSSANLLARISGTDSNVTRDVKLATSRSRCVVLVTPSYFPPTTFGSEVHYSEQAWGIRAELLQQASAGHGRSVAIADWAALSSPHHVASGLPGSWFLGDGLHPNLIGERALAELIVRTADTCQ